MAQGFKGDMPAIYDRLKGADCPASQTVGQRTMREMGAAADLARNRIAVKFIGGKPDEDAIARGEKALPDVIRIVEGKLANVEYESEPAFGFSIPKSCPGVPSEILMPRNSWKDKAAYDKTAADLAARFAKNFENFDAPPEVKAAGPKAQR